MKYSALTLGILSICSFTFSNNSQAEEPSYFIKAKHSGKCVSQSGGIQDTGGRVTQWECIDAPNIKLEKIPVGSGYFMLRFPHSNKCMTVEGDTTIGNIIQSECNSEAPVEQTWIEVPTTTTSTDSYVQIQSTYGTCLSQDSNSQENGVNISTEQCTNEANQLWKFAKADCAEFLQPYIDHASTSFLNRVDYTMISNVEGGTSYWATGRLTYSASAGLNLSTKFTGNLNRLSSNPNCGFNGCSAFDYRYPYKPTTIAITKSNNFIPTNIPLTFGDGSDISVTINGEISGAKVQCSRGHMYGFYLNPGDYRNIMFDITLRKIKEPK